MNYFRVPVVTHGPETSSQTPSKPSLLTRGKVRGDQVYSSWGGGGWGESACKLICLSFSRIFLPAAVRRFSQRWRLVGDGRCCEHTHPTYIRSPRDDPTYLVSQFCVCLGSWRGFSTVTSLPAPPPFHTPAVGALFFILETEPV